MENDYLTAMLEEYKAQMGCLPGEDSDIGIRMALLAHQLNRLGVDAFCGAGPGYGFGSACRQPGPGPQAGPDSPGDPAFFPEQPGG